jgi:CheY-like chemotaxis protein
MKRILIVDDDPGVATAVARALRGYEVTVAHNGPEALAVTVTRSRFDLLITDYLMPAMAGDELARRFRKHFPQTRTLLLTSFGGVEGVDTNAADACLAKPFRVATLRRVVTNLLEVGR